ncbi:hypothetical protein RIF29_14078 [Crotalaria pallida]|uniref:Uncharacterized protein n=1 Tax=Crotalaria pallida TaxID=3830 RepID=A0AAN9FAQ7_CROPI
MRLIIRTGGSISVIGSSVELKQYIVREDEHGEGLYCILERESEICSEIVAREDIMEAIEIAKFGINDE